MMLLDMRPTAWVSCSGQEFKQYFSTSVLNQICGYLNIPGLISLETGHTCLTFHMNGLD